MLVTVAGAGAAAWAAAGAAGAALTGSLQSGLVTDVGSSVAALAPTLTFPPDRDALDRLRTAVGPDALVVAGDRESAGGAAGRVVTDALRAGVRGGDRTLTERVVDGGRPWLVIGVPVVRTGLDGARTASGVEVYAARDLTAVDTEVGGVAGAAAGAAALTVPFAVVLAVLAAGSVLRPVRDLRDTARRLTAGDLTARAAPTGADELADLARTVDEMASSLQASMATMERMQDDARRFAADVSHELRTPLSTLTAVADVLDAAAADLPPDGRESVQLAVTEIQRLVRLVEDLMEISRLDAGTATLRREPVDVAEAVGESLRARGWAAEVELVAPPGPPLLLDRRRLDVIVANLVGNALRHGAPPVVVRVGGDADRLLVEVVDHGPGLADDVLPQVFDRFFKADPARGRTPGSGLGLGIARENARLHGGDLTVGTAGARGTRFVLWLPREAGDR
ncbi:sensor histidine kinase [Pseudonocardia sp. HH130630-07]|uniref:sensor histidine kinase n=1 Tax=Pseudonocardia sp. HH130630-07 TaxID=1690815 RepID=UPI000AD5630E|nr:HAMP domain-containing sensor histidine kinase [Pseudonocardia sp. HH130630-07]